MPYKRICAVLLLFFSLPFLAMSEEKLQDILAESKFTRSEKEMISAVFEEAKQKGIEETLLLPRLKEGRAKRVSASRLAAALQKEINFLVQALDLLLESRDGKKLLKEPAPLPRTANLLSWGARETEIRTFIEAAGDNWERYLGATHLFVSLSDWGLDRTSSAELTAAVTSSKIDSKDFPGFLDLLVRSRRGSRTPEEQSETIIDLLSQVANFSDLEERLYYE